jgi:hypothetical protein
MTDPPDEQPLDPLDYHGMVQRALRGVLREALEVAAEQGMPGEHHFYLSFRTRDPGVVVPPFLGDRYPEEVTVVLQRQFWDLHVDDEGFSVTLAFDASRHRLGVPWDAVTAFIDPAAEFALRFDAVGRGEGDGGEDDLTPAEDAEGSGQDTEGSADPTAEVVNISQFRKKDDP